MTPYTVGATYSEIWKKNFVQKTLRLCCSWGELGIPFRRELINSLKEEKSTIPANTVRLLYIVWQGNVKNEKKVHIK